MNKLPLGNKEHNKPYMSHIIRIFLNTEKVVVLVHASRNNTTPICRGSAQGRALREHEEYETYYSNTTNTRCGVVFANSCTEHIHLYAVPLEGIA